MGLLDEVKKKASAVESENEASAQRNADNQRFYESEIAPVMMEAQRYFAQLIDGLKVAAPQMDIAVPLIAGSERPVTMVQGNYKFDSDSSDEPRRLVIRCRCDLPEPISVRVNDKKSAMRQQDLLEQYGVVFHFRQELDSKHEICGGEFLIEGPMSGIVRLQVDVDDRCIYLDTKNLPEPRGQRRKLLLKNCNEAFFERVGRLLLREIDTVVEHKPVSDEVRERLRREVEAERQRNEELERQAAEAARIEREEEEAARLVNRIRKHSSEGLAKMASLFKKD